MRRILLAALLCMVALPLGAQQWAQARLERSPRHRQIVVLHPGGRAVQAFVAYPEASGKRPVVLVIHEIFGLSGWAQEVTDELAAAGYVAIAPDLLSGKGPGGRGHGELSEPDGDWAGAGNDGAGGNHRGFGRRR
ncbi:MAG: dienelactone hydrolase family protein [Terriglobales bacterium]